MGGFFGQRRRKKARPSVSAESVNFPGGERPSWAAQGTGVFETFAETLANVDQPTEPLFPIDTAYATSLLERREPKTQAAAEFWSARWRTRQGEPVGVGDYVALSLLDRPDATGTIVAISDDGSPVCALGDSADPRRKRERVTVGELNLVMLLRERR